MKKLNKVLLVDDDDIVNSIHSIIIYRANFADEVVVQDSARGALSYFTDMNTKGEFPEMVFLDINMPEMDGWDFIREYDKLEIKKSAKFIILTSSIDPHDQNRALAAKYVSEFLSKPLSVGILDRIMKEHF